MKSKTFFVFAAIYLVLTSAFISAGALLFKLPVRDALGNMVGIHLGFAAMYGLHRFGSKLWGSRAKPKKRGSTSAPEAIAASFPPDCIDILGMTKAQIDAEIKALEPIMDRGASTYKTYAELLNRLGTRTEVDIVLTIDEDQYVKACYRDMHLRHVRNMLFRQPSSQAKVIFS